MVVLYLSYVVIIADIDTDREVAKKVVRRSEVEPLRTVIVSSSHTSMTCGCD